MAIYGQSETISDNSWQNLEKINQLIFYQFDNSLLDVILAFGPWVGLVWGHFQPYQTCPEFFFL